MVAVDESIVAAKQRSHYIDNRQRFDAVNGINRPCYFFGFFCVGTDDDNLLGNPRGKSRKFLIGKLLNENRKRNYNRNYFVRNKITKSKSFLFFFSVFLPHLI